MKNATWMLLLIAGVFACEVKAGEADALHIGYSRTPHFGQLEITISPAEAARKAVSAILPEAHVECRRSPNGLGIFFSAKQGRERIMLSYQQIGWRYRWVLLQDSGDGNWILIVDVSNDSLQAALNDLAR